MTDHCDADCTGEMCSRLFNLCENICFNEGQEAPTAPAHPSINPMPSNSPAATELASLTPTPVTNITHTPAIFTVTITVSTNVNTFVISQSSCITTSTVLPTYTTTRIKEMPTTTTLTTTTTIWTPCPQNTIKLDVTQEPSPNKSCETFTSIKSTTTTVLSPVYLSCTPSPPQLATPPDKTNASTTSPALGAGPCIQQTEGVPAQGASSTNATSALGALLGLGLVLLVLVITGWMWTCWTGNRKRKSKNTSQNIR